MPLYQVEHICHLTDSQQDRLAASITRIHTETFTTPSLFVNVTFTNISSQRTYTAGKRKSTNRILAHVRHGPSRTQADYNDLCLSVQEAWNDIVADVIEDRLRPLDSVELKTIFVLGDIVAGLEAGFAIPPAGQDRKWLQDNIAEFERRAMDGDGVFLDLLDELKNREDMEGIYESDDD